MKLWGSVKQQANKLAYDAEKALRVKRQEGIIAELREKVQVQYAGLEAALALMNEGAIVHPRLAPFANEVALLQERIETETRKLMEIQAEQFESEEIGSNPSPALTDVPPPMPAAGSAPSGLANEDIPPATSATTDEQ